MAPKPKHRRLSVSRPRRMRRSLMLLLATVLVGGLGISVPLFSSAATSTYSLWSNSDVPVTPADPEMAALELGTRFTTTQSGAVTGVKFYKSSANTGTHTGSLWNSTGQRLATVTFQKETASGWQHAAFAKSVDIKAGSTYVISYTTKGRYAGDENYFANARKRLSGPLTGTAGVYRYGSGFPTNQWRASNYYVDVVFSTTAKPAPGSTPKPTTTTPKPTTTTPRPTTSPTVTATPRPTQTATPRPTTTTSAPSATPRPTQSATPTPTTPTTPVPPGKCVGAANTPGGADPWGGCWPGAHNTGYPKGLPGDTRKPVTLTNYTGATTIRSCGVVIDGKTVNGDIIIEAGNGTKSRTTPCVTIRNSLVKGVVFAEQDRFGPLVIEDTEIVPPGLPWWENLGRNNFFATRINSHGGEGVIKCDNNCEAKDSWIHGMRLGGEYHYNALGGNGTNGFKIEHNYASCGDWESVASPGSDAGCSAVIGFYGDFAPIQNITINRNFLISTFDTSSSGLFRQAGYCLNPGYYPGKKYPNTSGLIVTDNVFGRGGSGKCGVYGPTNSLNAKGAPNGNVWSGNRFDNGTAIARPEE